MSVVLLFLLVLIVLCMVHTAVELHRIGVLDHADAEQMTAEMDHAPTEADV